MSKEDYLTEDSIIPSGQKWACISFFSKNHVKQAIENNNDYKKEDDKEEYTTENNILGFKIRGVFDEYDEANLHAKKLRDIDQYHNIYVGEVGKWCAFILEESDNSKYVKQTEYANDQLNDMMKKYVDNQEKSKIFHEIRKNEMIIKNLNDNLETRLVNKEETHALLTNATDKDTKHTLKTSLLDIDEQIEKMQDKIKELKETEKVLTEKIKLGQLLM